MTGKLFVVENIVDPVIINDIDIVQTPYRKTSANRAKSYIICRAIGRGPSALIASLKCRNTCQ